MERTFAARGDIYYTSSPSCSLSIEDGWLVVVDGKVEGAFRHLPERYSNLPVKDFSGKLVIPGLSDLHVHAGQYQFRGLWMDEELIQWLNTHTFPEEAKYRDEGYADRAYDIFVDDLLYSTTTRASIFATIHPAATLMLCRKLEKAGLPCLVGKVNMDRNSPDFLCEDTKESIDSTLEYIEEVESSFRLVRPVITPRFIPSCTDELSRALSSIANERGLPVQTHLSENLSELEWVKDLCPESTSYADAYRRLGLWGGTRTVMAHCVYSLGHEEDMLEDANIWIAHCPDSNTNLSSGLMCARYYLDRGCRIGLGSDVAGGTTLSMLRAITDAVKVSKMYWRHVDQSMKPICFREAFHMASVISGSFFGRVGSFEEGCDADIVVLDDSTIPTTVEGLGVEERLERYAYLRPHAPVAHKAIQGRWLF